MEGDLLMKNYKEIKHLAEEAKKKEQEEKRFCKLCQKPETRSECSYGEKVSQFQFNLSKEKK
jgi:preprotein translocase subunit Sss1